MIEPPIVKPIKKAIELVAMEYVRAALAHAPMHSAHEGYAVLLEEMNELWDEIKKHEPDQQAMIDEAIQVGAMAIRFLVDVCGVGGTKDDG